MDFIDFISFSTVALYLAIVCVGVLKLRYIWMGIKTNWALLKNKYVRLLILGNSVLIIFVSGLFVLSLRLIENGERIFATELLALWFVFCLIALGMEWKIYATLRRDFKQDEK